MQSELNSAVLVVDDDTNIRESLAAYLEVEGYTVFTAENGADALRVLNRQPGTGLILLDLQMPEMDGLEFRRAQLSDHRLAAIPVVLMSGDDSAPEQAGEGAIRSILPKPFHPDELMHAVRRFVGPGKAASQLSPIYCTA